MATKKNTAPGKTTKAEPKSASTKAAPSKAAAPKGKTTTTKAASKATTKVTESPKTAAAKTAVNEKPETIGTPVAATSKKFANRVISPEQIAVRAYMIWVERGYSHGGDINDWLRAEAELNQLN